MISIKNGNIVVSGEQFDSNGMLKATWTTQMSKYDGNTLRYVYQARHSTSKKIEEIIGFSTIDFARSSIGALPMIYHGYLVDFARNFERNTFSGYRLHKKSEIVLLDSLEGKKELAINYLNLHKI